MARLGTNADGTNTILDDNGILRDPAARLPLTGQRKQRCLARCRIPGAVGVSCDVSGRQVNTPVCKSRILSLWNSNCSSAETRVLARRPLLWLVAKV